eukprot:3761016-Prymnesium_polylepis.1
MARGTTPPQVREGGGSLPTMASSRSVATRALRSTGLRAFLRGRHRHPVPSYLLPSPDDSGTVQSPDYSPVNSVPSSTSIYLPHQRCQQARRPREGDEAPQSPRPGARGDPKEVRDYG